MPWISGGCLNPKKKCSHRMGTWVARWKTIWSNLIACYFPKYSSLFQISYLKSYFLSKPNITHNVFIFLECLPLLCSAGKLYTLFKSQFKCFAMKFLFLYRANIFATFPMLPICSITTVIIYGNLFACWSPHYDFPEFRAIWYTYI